jgi:hypothetical protein
MQIAIDLPWARPKSAPVEVPNIELPHVDLAAKVEDTKRAVSDGAESISAVAQDLGSQAATIGREAIKIASDAAKAGRTAAKKGQLFAATSGDTLRQLRSDAAAAADDLRSIRIVRDRQRGPDLKPGLALVAGVSAGVAAMFFLDPEQGRRRRILFVDQLRKYSRLSGEWLDGTTRDVRNRTQGLAAEARKAAESIRPQGAEFEDDMISATPDVSGELSSTDWSEPVAAETYRGN